MFPIFILALQVLSAFGRPQNDGLIHTDLILERRDDQNDGLIHTDLILERRDELPEVPDELVDFLANVTNREAESRAANSCGCAEASASGRIVGGSEVEPKYKYPYQVYFQANGYMCGGTILNKRYVLTAMHCLYDQNGSEHPASKTSVIIGEHNLDDGMNEGGQYIEVEEFIKRSDYDSTNIVNDIAILKLKTEITFTDNVKPACLPTDTSKTYEGQWGIVSGWGGTVGYAYGEDVQQQSSTHALKVTSVKILGSSDCRRMTSGDSATRMCAFATDTDSCQGDSGGPMTVVEDGKYTVVGVVSYGSGCASTTPGVYARVTNYLSWISTNTQDGDCEEGSTDTSTEGSTDASTEGSTDTSTDGSTDTSTEGSTDTSTEGYTDTSTEGSTDTSTEGSTDTSTGGSTCSYTDRYSNCGDYKDYCDYSLVSTLCPKTCKCSDDSTDTTTCSYTDEYSNCGDYKDYCRYSQVSNVCPKTCKC